MDEILYNFAFNFSFYKNYIQGFHNDQIESVLITLIMMLYKLFCHRMYDGKQHGASGLYKNCNELLYLVIETSLWEKFFAQTCQTSVYRRRSPFFWPDLRVSVYVFKSPLTEISASPTPIFLSYF